MSFPADASESIKDVLKTQLSKLLRPGDSLKWRVIQGTVAVLVGDAYLHGIRLAGNLIMTRLLYPEAFGLMLIVNLFFMALQMLSDAGIHAAVIVKSRDRGQSFIDTAWALLVIRGVLLTTVGLLLAKPIAEFYQQPILYGLISAASISAMIAGFTSPNTIIYDREIKKIRVVLLDVVSITLSMSITICWLLIHPTIWALIAYMLITDTLKVLLSFKLFEGQKPRLRIDAKSAAEIFSFGRWIFLSTALAFLATQGDKLVVSKWVTTEQLGVFSIAIGLAKITELISGSVNMKLMLPLYSEMGHETGSGVLNREARAKMALFLICAPFVLIFSLCGDLLVQFLYDPRYHGAGWMLQIMALGTLFSSHNDTMGSLIISRGRSYAHMLLQAYRVSTLLISMFIGGYFFGLTGLVYAIALGPALFYPVISLYCRGLGLRSMRYDAVAFSLVFLVVFSVWHSQGWPHD